jgi:DHA1 family inner membrane transport protein
MIAVGGALVAILLPLTVPKLNADQDASPLSELSGMRGMQVWLTLLTAAIGFAGMFAIYSYITPTLVETTGQPETRVPAFLALWGLGMVVGNVLGGWLTDRSQTLAIGGMLVWNMIVLGLFMPAAGNGATAAVSLFVIGTGFALVPALQARLMDVAPKAQSLAAAMNHSAFNLSNAIGAWTGGLAISAGWGWSSTGAVAAALAFVGLLAFIVAISIEKRSKAGRS